MSRQSFTGVDVSDFPPSSFTAVANTTTDTVLWTSALWTPIPALDMKPGKLYVVRAGGIISTTGTPTAIFTPRFGTTTGGASLGATNTFTLGTVTNAPWFLEFYLGVRSIGLAASGATITGNGFVQVGGAAGAVSQHVGMGSTVVTTADHTTAQGLVVSLTWGAASASNTATCQWANIQTLN